jgi:hypothetical protein
MGLKIFESIIPLNLKEILSAGKPLMQGKHDTIKHFR